MLRKIMILAVPAAGSLLGASAAQAECQSDADCQTGEFCSYGGDIAVGAPAVDCAPDTDCEQPAPEPAPAAECQPLPDGFCVQQSDCADNLVCVIDTYTTGCDDGPTEPGATDGGTGDAPAPTPSDPRTGAIIEKQTCTPTEVKAPYGHCELPVVNCDTDDQCLAGLSCVDASGGSTPGSSDGGSSGSTGTNGGTVEPQPAPAGLVEKDANHVCGYEPKTCTQDTECGTGYECVEIAVGGSCSGGGATSCSSDGVCDPAPEPTEPECTTDYESYCFPKQLPCNVDAECTDGWTCVEFSNADGGLESPPWWNANGPVKSCLPEGLAALAQSAYGAQGVAERGGSLPGAYGNDSLGGANGGEQAPTSANDEDGDAKSSSGGGGGGACSVAFGGGTSSGALAFLAGLVGLVSRRRRRAA